MVWLSLGDGQAISSFCYRDVITHPPPNINVAVEAKVW